MDYLVLESNNVKILETKVKDHIYKGWDLVGGASVWTYGPNNSSAIYTQTMVYYEKEGPKPLNVIVQNWPVPEVKKEVKEVKLTFWQKLRNFFKWS